jgi:hypothetical protein
MDGPVQPQVRAPQLLAWISARSQLIAMLWTAACLVTLLAIGWQHITATMPYVQHIDERTLMRGAKRVLQEGGLNPRIYNYPSLPFYLTAAGLAWGTIQASGNGPEHVTAKALGRLEPPYYERMAVGAGARKLWLVLGVGCVAAAAVLASALGGAVAMVITTLLLAVTAIPMATAREYVNVDVPLALFVVMLLAHLARSAGSSTYRDRVWTPALLCGAAMASKYTGVVTLVPALLAVWLHAGPSRLARSFELGALAVLVFLVLCPRFVMDLPSFLDGISFESFHYRFKGHKRFTLEPGSAQFFAYSSDIVAAFGWGLVLLSGLGAVSLVRSDARRAAVMLSFPVCWLAMLYGTKVHFLRNLLPVMFCVAVLAAYGVTRAWALTGALASRFGRRGDRRIIAARIAAVTLVALCTLPFESLIETHRRHTDSRNRFARWAAANVPEGSTLLIPEALPFATETLPQNIPVQRVDLRDAQATIDAARPGAFMVVPHWTADSGGVAERVAALAPGIAALPRHRVIREFSGSPAAPGMESEMSVDPAFSFVRFEP